MSTIIATFNLKVTVPGGVGVKEYTSVSPVIQSQGDRYYEKTKIVGTTAELVDFDLLGETNIGTIWIQNLDAVNFLSLGLYSDNQWDWTKIPALTARILFPKKPAYSTAHWYIRADTAPINVLYAGFEK